MTQKVKSQKSKVICQKHIVIFAFCLLPCRRVWSEMPTAASGFYDPAWASELGWTSGTLYQSPTGSRAWLDNANAPWWQTEVAHPVNDYAASKIPVGSV